MGSGKGSQAYLALEQVPEDVVGIMCAGSRVVMQALVYIWNCQLSVTDVMFKDCKERAVVGQSSS